MHKAALTVLAAILVAVLAAAFVLALMPPEPDAGGWRIMNGEVRAWLITGADGEPGERTDGGPAGEGGAGGGAARAGETENGAGTADGESGAEAADGTDGPAVVNINRATAEELDALPGIGPAKARAIIEYRETYGPFETLEELMEVKGIGPKTFERLKDRIGL